MDVKLPGGGYTLPLTYLGVDIPRIFKEDLFREQNEEKDKGQESSQWRGIVLSSEPFTTDYLLIHVLLTHSLVRSIQETGQDYRLGHLTGVTGVNKSRRKKSKDP